MPVFIARFARCLASRGRGSRVFSTLDLSTRLRSDGVHADALALPGCLFEAHLTVNKCKQRMVASNSHVAARLDRRAPLPHQHGAGCDDRPVAALDAQALAAAVPTVARASHTFLVSHGCC